MPSSRRLRDPRPSLAAGMLGKEPKEPKGLLSLCSRFLAILLRHLRSDEISANESCSLAGVIPPHISLLTEPLRSSIQTEEIAATLTWVTAMLSSCFISLVNLKCESIFAKPLLVSSEQEYVRALLPSKDKKRHHTTNVAEKLSKLSE